MGDKTKTGSERRIAGYLFAAAFFTIFGVMSGIAGAASAVIFIAGHANALFFH